MSSRYPPVHESRYVPRDRSRSPPRFPDRRSSGPYGSGYQARNSESFRGGSDLSRAPAALNDTHRGPGPGGGSAPLGPRGRGLGGRGEFRELRDAPPLGTDRDRQYRERDTFDRGGRGHSPRGRSPPRPFRDAREYTPRELDIPRARRASREGPPSAGSNFSDPPPFSSAPFRGGFGRGRGRGDWDHRGRGGRRPHLDDRDLFRPRGRSPGSRWSRDPSREGRESERRDEWRFDRWEDERRTDKEERDREPDKFRRELIPNRLDTRNASEAPANLTTLHQQGPPPPLSAVERTGTFDPAHDSGVARRPSAVGSAVVPKDLRREQEKTDLITVRAEASRDRYGPSASSPPPQAPQVPAFGSVSFKSAVYTGPTSNVWKAPQEPKPAQPAQVPPTQQPAPTPAPADPPRLAPIAPKAQLAQPPPTAPKAPRALELALQSNSRDAPPTGPTALLKESQGFQNVAPAPMTTFRPEPQPSLGTWHAPQVSPYTTAPPRTFETPRAQIQATPSPSILPQASPLIDANSMPLGQARSTFTGAPPGPRPSSASGTSHSQSVARGIAPQKARTPPPSSAPSGPRGSYAFSASPRITNANIPTAPKAVRAPAVPPRVPDRVPPAPVRLAERPSNPIARGLPATTPKAPAWNQWIRPGAPTYKEFVVPAKRDAAGLEKDERYPTPHVAPASLAERKASEPADHGDTPMTKRSATVDDEGARDSVARTTEQSFPSTLVQNVHADKSAPSPATEDASRELIEATRVDQSSDDDDGMDLDEGDFAANEVKFLRDRARLVTQMLSLTTYEIPKALERIDRNTRVLPDVDALDDTSSTAAEGLPDPGESHIPEPALAPDHDMEEARLLTPKAEEMNEADGLGPVEDVSEFNADLLNREPSAEAITLPYLVKGPPTPLSERETSKENFNYQNIMAKMIAVEIDRTSGEQSMTEVDAKVHFTNLYHHWRLKARELDRDMERKEILERQASSEPAPEPDVVSVSVANPILGAVRMHRFSSEYVIEQVIKQSEETARIEQEKLDREAKKAQADLEKEAYVPEQLHDDEFTKALFKDTNQYREPTVLSKVFAYQPAPADFTLEEHTVFAQGWKENPKKWGVIATLLPGRNYQDCINHYYAFKWDGRFREKKTKKTKYSRARGGRGSLRGRGTAFMGESARREEVEAAPAGVSDTGRPKRAAAPTNFGERELEMKQAVLAPTPNKKLIGASKPDANSNGDTVSDRPVKRRKAAPGEKIARKGRAQP
ncbi:hypothetical protein LTR66_014184, partial [Elasticomyces elasticus]